MSKLRCIPISLREANDFVEQFHRHNGRTQLNGGRFAIGVTDESELWGVAIVGRPLFRMLQDGYTAEATRVCVRDGAPKNCNSFLYVRCWRIWQAMGGLKLVTYTLATESGASLRAANWRVVAEVKPSAEWSRSGRERDWQPIYGQLKIRWEINSHSLSEEAQ